jgi:hypothetical protein
MKKMLNFYSINPFADLESLGFLKIPAKKISILKGFLKTRAPDGWFWWLRTLESPSPNLPPGESHYADIFKNFCPFFRTRYPQPGASKKDPGVK